MQDTAPDADFVYQASDDGLAEWPKFFTSRFGDETGHFEEDLLATVRMLAAAKAGGDFLDVGTGNGRIAELIRGFARKVVGIEPDSERYLAWRSGFEGTNVEMVNRTMQAFRRERSGEKFDYVTVSMVLQHVSRPACAEILAGVRDMLADAGIAIVSTTLMHEERFTVEQDPAPRAAHDFDSYADDPAGQHMGVAVRFFSKETFLAEIARAGLELVEWRQFSYTRAGLFDQIGEMFAIPPEWLRDTAISQYAVVRRGVPEVRAPDPTRKRGLFRRLRARP